MRSFPIVLASALLLASTQDCAVLPSLDVCGNGLVDPGEDCDGQAGLPAGAHCGAPSTTNACRYTCQVGDASKSCPGEYSCSTVDGVCRKASGLFSQLTPVPFKADHMAVADFNGDGIADVFASQGEAGGLQARVYFFGDKGVVASETAVPPVSFGAAAPLTGKTAAADLVGFLSQNDVTGMLVMRGDASRSLVPASFSSFPAGKPGTVFLPFYSTYNGLLALRGSKVIGFDISYLAASPVRTLKEAPHLDFGRAGYLGDTAQGRYRLAFANAHDVDVFEFDSVHGAQVMTVSLPNPMATIADFWFSNFDDDALQDLVILTKDSHVFVAYGTPDPSLLAASPGAIGTSLPTAVDVKFMGSAFGCSSDFGSGRVLGAQNLTGSTTGQIIGDSGVFSEQKGFWQPGPCFTGSASEVVAADFNRDGATDLMVALEGTAQLEFLLNAGGGLFNSVLIPLSGPAKHLVVGDFDGDLYPDVAFAETLGGGQDKVGFVFGAPGAEPAGPIEAGPFSTVSQVLANGNILDPSSTSERSDLLAVTGSGDSARLAVFPGSPNREMYSPWFFVPHGATSPETPSSAAIGAYSSGTSNELATLISAFGASPALCLLADSTKGTLTQPVGPTALPKKIDSSYAAIVNVAGKPGGQDQVAVVGQTDDTPPRGMIAMAHAVGSAFEFPKDQTRSFDTPPLLFDVQQTQIVMPGGRMGDIVALGNTVPRLPACAADLDGDGATDLAFIGAGKHGSSLLIAWQDNGALASPSVIALEHGLEPHWIACIRTPTGTGIALLEGDDVHIIQCGGAKRTCTAGPSVARALSTSGYGSSTGPHGGPPVISNTGPNMMLSSGSSSGVASGSSGGFGSSGSGSSGGSGSPEPTTLAVGDVTGDGLDDLVLTGFGRGIQIFAAKPTIR